DVDEVGEDALPHDIRGIALGRHSVSHTNSILPHSEARAGGCRTEVLCYSRHLRGRSSAAEHQLPKLRTRVRFPSPALSNALVSWLVSTPRTTARERHLSMRSYRTS